MLNKISKIPITINIIQKILVKPMSEFVLFEVTLLTVVEEFCVVLDELFVVFTLLELSLFELLLESEKEFSESNEFSSNEFS